MAKKAKLIWVNHPNNPTAATAGPDFCREVGHEMMNPKAIFSCWGAIRKGYNSKDFCFTILEEADGGMIPDSTYGKNGEEFVRIACTQSTERIAEAMEPRKKFMSNL